MGRSGSGKSTLLHLAAGLDRPTDGTVVLDGVDLTALREKQLTVLRRDRIGFIFQSFNLLPALTVAQKSRSPCGSLVGGSTSTGSAPCWIRSVSPTWPADARRNCLVDNNNEWPLPAP